MNGWITHEWMEAIGWTVAHSLWQGMLVALAAGLFVKISGSRSARLNYGVHCAALGAVLLWAGWTFTARAPSHADEMALPGTAAPQATTMAGIGTGAEGAPPLPSNSSGMDWAAVMPWVGLLWIVGALAMSLRLGFAAVWIQRLRASAAPWEDSEWQERFRNWKEELGIHQAARLCESALAGTPAVIGHFKPLVLLPAAILTRLSPDQLEAVILHELMHIRRNDYLVNLLQTACETVFFFNPAVWWISRSIRVEREHCCDELAAARHGSRLDYAKALLRLEELRFGGENLMAMAAGGGSLRVRVMRLLRPESAGPRAPGWSAVASILVLLGLALSAGWPLAHAQAESAEDAESRFELRAVAEPGANDAETLPFRSRGGPEKLAVQKEILLNDSHLAEVSVTEDILTAKPQILVKLTPEGKERFAKATRDHLDRQIAVIIDGTIYSAPIILEPITGGDFVISANFTQAEAAALARHLRAALDQEVQQAVIRAAGPEEAGETAAPAWTPAPDARPSTVLAEARQARREGRYAEALARHEWYHDASRHEPGQGGVRLSFALSDWLELGQLYPPALRRLQELRVNTGERLRSFKKTDDVFAFFQEYNALNRTLREEADTAAMFAWLDEHHPEIARKVYDVARPSLIRAGKIELAAKYADPDELRRARRTMELDRRLGHDFGERKFRHTIPMLVALLVTRGDQAEAKAVADEALKIMNDPELKKLLDEALEGKIPEPWP